jgi:hypothetical protein
MRLVPRPANYIEAVRPKLVRVTRKDSTKVLITGAHVQGDTLMGFIQRPGGAMGEFTEMPLAEVATVEAQRYATGKTMLAVTGGLLVWAGIAYGFVKYVEATN